MKRLVSVGLRRGLRMGLLAGSLAASLTTVAFAQQFEPITTPDVSQKANVGQTIGVTEIAVTYHRPGVNGRTIWGDLVPYGEVWRAGANENTTISFSTPVLIEGQPLAAGTYGLHMIPTATSWTVILSNDSKAWGSYAYDAAHDALRVTVTPQPADFVERLAYTFDDPGESSTIVSLRWEKLRVSFRIGVDVTTTTLARIREQLTGLPQFYWQGWNQAAVWSFRNGGNLDEALAWANKSVAIAPTFQGLRTKAAILERKGDSQQATELRARAMTMATEADLNMYGYSLLGQKKVDEALEVFKRNASEHPQSWNVYDSLADAYVAKGDRKAALTNYAKALSLTSDDQQKKRINDAMKKLM